jgi:arylsulfatase A
MNQLRLRGGRSLLPLAAMGGFVLVFAAGSAPLSAASSKPNIIYILADDLGIGDLGVTGQNARAAAGLPAIATPNIDALAQQGMTFTRMYSTPLCTPSRASLLTGFEMHHLHRDVTEGIKGLRGGQLDKTWGQTLQEAGYTTGMFGKWHLGGVDWPGGPRGVYDYVAIPTQKGFEIVNGTMAGGYRTDHVWEEDGMGGLKKVVNVWEGSWRFTDNTATDRILAMINDSVAADQPFAAYVALQAPHEPLNQIPTGPYTDKTWPLVQKQYAAMVDSLDRNVGRIMEAVSDPNNDGNMSDSIASNTIVVFSSDNGPLWNGHAVGFNNEFFDSNGSYRGEKSNTLEGGIRSPFFVRWDGVTTPGSVNNSHVGTLADVYPTLAELAGLDTPFGLDGVSMLPAITGTGLDMQQDAHVWTARYSFLNQASWVVQMADWKLIRRMSNMGYELYHISADPYETTNLAATKTDVRDALQAVAALEGVLEEPFFQTGGTAPQNVFYTQYKTWAPQPGSTSFGAATNWAGGTQFNADGDPQSLYWNTGPGPNWLATVSNTLGGHGNAFVDNAVKVLALEVRGEVGTMQVSIMPGARLDAYNGVRVSNAGVLQIDGGTLATARQLDVRAGGSLTGDGLITGYQSVIAGIPEFEGKKLLEPEVLNAGVVDIFDGLSAGLLTIDGDFRQGSSGELRIDIFGDGGVPGVDFDTLAITGDATLGGSLYVDLNGAYTPALGQLFPVLSAGSLTLAGLKLTGPDASMFALAVESGADLVLTYVDADFDADGVVDGGDLVIWQQHFGAATSQGDANNDGWVDGADFLTWQRQVGSPAVASPAGGSSVAEPSGAALAMLSAMIGGALCHPRRFMTNTAAKAHAKAPTGRWPVEPAFDA